MDIPEDILSAAVAVVDRGYNTGLIDAVAEALMAERQQCSVVAREAALYSGCPADFIADEIAEAILLPRIRSVPASLEE